MSTETGSVFDSGGNVLSTKLEQLAEPQKTAGACVRLSAIRTALAEFSLKSATLHNSSIALALIGAVVLLLVVGLAVGLRPTQHNNCLINVTIVSDSSDVAIASGFPVAFEADKPWTHWRLPSHVIPRHYNISLSPELYTENDSSFKGNVTIEATVVAETKLIILHSIGLQYDSIEVNYSKDSFLNSTVTIIPMERNFQFEPHDYLVIEFKSTLKLGSQISLRFSFSGNLSQTPEGFYKSSFKHPSNGTKLFVAMTHFEALHARRAFPCFDEPNFKAFFTIAIQHRSDFLALSNMPQIIRTQSNDGDISTTTRFQTTNVPMPTYLVAFVVGQYASLPSVTSSRSKVPITVYAPDYALEQTRFALDVLPQMLDWMENYFGVDYPLPKLELIVYPMISGKGMGTLGLVSLAEQAILETNLTSETARDFIVARLAHELGQLWFGNLVTINWWNDLWLNKGMTSYIKFLSSVAVGRLVDSEEYYDILSAISEDFFDSSRPIRPKEVQTTGEVGSVVDATTHMKGSTVLRMLANAIGIDRFRNGVRNYLKKYEFKSTKTSNLWNEISEEYDGVNITSVMETWVDQRGFPLLSVEIGNAENELVLRQDPFVVPQWNRGRKWMEQPTSNDARTWWIPLTIKEPNGNIRVEWFPPYSSTFRLNLSSGTKLLETKLNANQTAFIRVNYPVTMWEKFGEKLAQDVNAFEPMDRAGIVDDCLELAKAGLLQYDTAFRTIRFLAKETHPLVWDVFVAQANFLNQMLWDSPQYSKFKAWLSGTIRSARVKAIQDVANVTPQNAIKNPNYKRILAVLAEAALLFDPGVDAQCYVISYFRDSKWKKVASRELRRAVFIASIQSDADDTEQGIDKLIEIYKRIRLKQLQKEVFYAISTAKQFSLITRELEKAFSGELTPTEFLVLANSVLDTNIHRAAIWDWACEHFHLLKPLFGGTQSQMFLNWFLRIAKYFNSPFKLDEFNEFASRTVGSSGEVLLVQRRVEQEIRRNIYWRHHLKKQVETYLADSGDIPPSPPATNIC